MMPITADAFNLPLGLLFTSYYCYLVDHCQGASLRSSSRELNVYFPQGQGPWANVFDNALSYANTR